MQVPNIRIAFLICLFFVGCGEKTEPVAVTPDVKTEIHRDKHWYTPWRKSEEEWQAIEEEKARTVIENKERLVIADALLDVWSAKLDEQQNKGNGFVHHEGITELDPWGNMLRVEYHQVNLKEFMTVRSLGPDGQQGTEDDLVRKKYAMNYPGMFKGLNWIGILVLIWMFLGIISLLLFLVDKKRHDRKHSSFEMTRALAFCVILAPFAALTYGIQLQEELAGR